MSILAGRDLRERQRRNGIVGGYSFIMYDISLLWLLSHFTTSSLSQFGSERDAMEWTFMDVSSIFRTKQVSYSLILTLESVVIGHRHVILKLWKYKSGL